MTKSLLSGDDDFVKDTTLKEKQISASRISKRKGRKFDDDIVENGQTTIESAVTTLQSREAVTVGFNVDGGYGWGDCPR